MIGISRILNSNALLNGVMKTIQLLAILILTAFVIVVILVGSGVIFGKAFAQINFREDMWVLQTTVWQPATN